MLWNSSDQIPAMARPDNGGAAASGRGGSIATTLAGPCYLRVVLGTSPHSASDNRRRQPCQSLARQRSGSALATPT
eukprot:1457783-Lingulodinium_polyedra.AAC.1